MSEAAETAVGARAAGSQAGLAGCRKWMISFPDPVIANVLPCKKSQPVLVPALVPALVPVLVPVLVLRRSRYSHSDEAGTQTKPVLGFKRRELCTIEASKTRMLTSPCLMLTGPCFAFRGVNPRDCETDVTAKQMGHKLFDQSALPF